MGVITHNSRFHADEVTATALIMYSHHIAGNDNIRIYREDHNSNVEDLITTIESSHLMYYVVDTGGVYDGMIYFDHHQEGGSTTKSSAGLVYDHLVGLENLDDIPVVRNIINSIDAHDTGRYKAEALEIPTMIESMYNTGMTDTECNEAFLLAVQTMYHIISTAYHNYNRLNQMVNAILDAKYIANTNIVECITSDVSGWSRVITREVLLARGVSRRIDGVVSKAGDKYILKTMQESLDSYTSNIKLPQSSDMEFVHKEGFIATDSTYNRMRDYVLANLRI